MSRKAWKKMDVILKELAEEENLDLDALEDVWFSIRKGVKWAIGYGGMEEIRIPYLCHFEPVAQLGVMKIMKMTKLFDYYEDEFIQRRKKSISTLIEKNGNDSQKRILEYALSIVSELEAARSQNPGGSEDKAIESEN